MYRIAILTLFLIFSAGAVASEVYRCQGEDGSLVFSQQPCADDAERIRLGDQQGGWRPTADRSVQAAAEIRALCHQAMNQLIAFLNESARALHAAQDVEAAALLRSIAEERGGVSQEDVEACYAGWNDQIVRGSWQCMATARNQASRQDCVDNDRGGVFASFAFD